MALTSATQPKLLSFTEARQAVEEYASRLSPTEPEMLSLLDAVGLVLAEDLRADRDFPPFPRSTRDGYAVRAADVAVVPARLHLIGEIKAGASSEQSGITIGAGEAAEIMTGAPVPSGADAVVMVEYTERSGEVVTVQRAAQPGENIVAAGSEATQGIDHGGSRHARHAHHRRCRGGRGTRRDRSLSPASRRHPGHRR